MRISKTKNTKVTVFTTNEILSRIETYLENKSQYEFVLKDDNESINNYLKKVEKICNKNNKWAKSKQSSFGTDQASGGALFCKIPTMNDIFINKVNEKGNE